MRKNIIITFISLIAIFVMLINVNTSLENTRDGKSVDLPEALYAKMGSGYHSPHLIVTVDKNGDLFGRELNPLSLPQFTKEIIEYDSVDLRVDRRCKFEDLKPTLSALNKSDVTYTCFKVTD